MKQDTSVKLFYRYGGYGLSDASIVTALDTAINATSTNFGYVAISSIVIAYGVAIVTTTSAHRFIPGQVVKIIGCNNIAGLNSEWKILVVDSATKFSFFTDETGTPSGTMSATLASLTGITKTNLGSSQFAYNFTDTPYGFFMWSTSSGYSDYYIGLTKNNVEDNAATTSISKTPTPTECAFISNGKIFYYVDITNTRLIAAGSFTSLLAGDAHNFLVTNSGTTLDTFIARTYLQTGSAIRATLNSFAGGGIGTTGGGTYTTRFPVSTWEATTGTPTVLRGYLPGIYNYIGPTVTANSCQLHSKRGLYFPKSSGMYAFDITGPWGN